MMLFMIFLAGQLGTLGKMQYSHSAQCPEVPSPGGEAGRLLHVVPPPQLRSRVKLDGAGVVAQEPQ